MYMYIYMYMYMYIHICICIYKCVYLYIHIHTHAHTHTHTHTRTRTHPFTHLYVRWCDSFVYVLWLIHIWTMAHSYMTCFLYDMTHLPIYRWVEAKLPCASVLCDIYERVMSQVWLSHVAHMNTSFHTGEWVMSHMWISHDTHTHTWIIVEARLQCESGSCLTCSHVNDLCHMYEWVMPHICKWVIWHTWFIGEWRLGYRVYLSRLNESCHTYEWVMTHIYKWVIAHT